MPPTPNEVGRSTYPSVPIRPLTAVDMQVVNRIDVGTHKIQVAAQELPVSFISSLQQSKRGSSSRQGSMAPSP